MNRRRRTAPVIHSDAEQRVAGGGNAVQVAVALGPDTVTLGRLGIELYRALLEREAAQNGIPINAGVPEIAYNALLLATAHRENRGHADVRNSPAPATSEPWISTSAAAAQAGVTARTVRRWAGVGYLGRTTRRKGVLLVCQASLDVHLAARSHPTDPEETPA